MLIYAKREDNRARKLVAIKCDGCGAEIKPSPDISNSGWEKRGVYYSSGSEEYDWHYCSQCLGHGK